MKSGLLPLLVLLAAGCAAPEEPASGGLEVISMTSGPAPDADGYAVSVDRGPSRRLERNDTLRFAPLADGDHEVRLGNIAVNCLLDGDSTRSVSVQLERTARIEFAVACASTSGIARVSATTTGVELDPNGYEILVDGAPAGVVADSGMTDLVLTGGEHAISLAGLTANCQVQAPDRHAIVVPTGGVAGADFSVRCDAALPAGPGREIAFVTTRDDPEASGLVLMNVDGTGFRRLLASARSITWSPDGRQLAATSRLFSSQAGLVVGELDAEGRTAQFRDLLSMDFIGGLAWSPDGREIAYLSPNPGDADDLRAITPDGTTDRLVVPFVALFGSANPSWSPDGSTIVFVSDTGLELVDADGTNGRRFAEGFLRATTPAWSPDGTRMAFAAVADTTAFIDLEFDIFVVPLDGSEFSRLTRAPGSDLAPSWSPDGTRMAFVSHRDGNPEIYVMNADGTEQVRITDNPGLDSLPVWRPSGP